ncbi:MAG: Uma2 family endonuclease [Leptospiraceae bacterium]|nr:Uma2 family endonuclease [Leptospiraceae bacterium]
MSSITHEREVRTYTIRFPKSYPLKEKLSELQKLNPDFVLSVKGKNSLLICESAFLLEDYGYFGIKLPGFTWKMFERLEKLNKEINFEFNDEEEIFIKMGIFALIGALTAAVLSSLYVWARSKNRGRVYADPGGYELDHPERPDKKIRRIPDISYISFESVSEEEQDSWDGFIPHPPNLVIEIVSAKYGLTIDLKKMETVWMKTGVDVGIVICPFSEKIYIFEKGKPNHTTQSLYSDFTHPLLPEYFENFGKYWKKK